MTLLSVIMPSVTTFRERAPRPSAAVPGVELRGGAGEGDDGREEGQALHRPQHAHGVVVGFRREGTVSSPRGSFKNVTIHVAWFIRDTVKNVPLYTQRQTMHGHCYHHL